MAGDMTSTTVYTITKGEYSSYSIIRIFADQEQAERYAVTKGHSYRVEELALHTGELPEPRQLHHRHAWVNYDGTRVRTETPGAKTVFPGIDGPPTSARPHVLVSPIHHPSPNMRQVFIAVTGYDEAALEKVISERVASVVATIGQGGIEAVASE